MSKLSILRAQRKIKKETKRRQKIYEKEMVKLRKEQKKLFEKLISTNMDM